MGQRADKVSSLIIKEVSQILREDVSQPDIGFITLVGCRVTDDLKHAIILYSVLGTDAQKRKTQNALKHCASYVKRLLNDRIRLRYAVDISFEPDQGIDHAFEIEAILEKIRRERKRESEENKS